VADIRQVQWIFGNATTPTTLTTSYVVSNAFATRTQTMIGLDVDYTMGGAGVGNSIQIKVEFASPSARSTTTGEYTAVTADWHQMVSTNTASGVATVNLHNYTFAATQAVGTYDRFHIDLPTNAFLTRVWVKETVAAGAAGNCYIKAVIDEQFAV